jgi:hypothetical protein
MVGPALHRFEIIGTLRREVDALVAAGLPRADAIEIVADSHGADRTKVAALVGK